MAEPLSKEERDEIDVRIAKMYRVHHQTETHETLAQAIRRYEATVKDRDERIAALEAENEALRCRLSCAEDDASFCNTKRNEAEAEVARLRPLAEVGEAVEGMPVGFGLSHAGKELWLVWDSGGGEDLDETCGPTPLAALEALAALRAAKGHGDA